MIIYVSVTCIQYVRHYIGQPHTAYSLKYNFHAAWSSQEFQLVVS